ncbi:MAG: pilus assembly protein PilP [Hydrogenophilales bacterium]|nr:pilus assembly protein PilP [Hydrogenophilales bacterium]
MKNFTVLTLLSLLAACGNGDDPRAFVAGAGKDLRGKVDPLPEVKPYEPFTYAATDLPDPFKPRKLTPPPGEGKGGGIQPPRDHVKQILENYPLEGLKMVGTLQQNKMTFALVKTPDNNLYRVKQGNYMGQNFGIVTQVTDTEINLTEIVQDSGGDWTERATKLEMSESTAQQTPKK